MNSLIIFAHPNPRSFNAALKDAALDELRERGGTVRVHDLYGSGFDPVLTTGELPGGSVPEDVKALQGDVAWAELLVLVHPTWWVGVPAILKGYFDRVLSYGFAFRMTESGPEGLLRGKAAVILQTAGSSAEIATMFKIPQTLAQSVGVGTLGYCGIRVAAHELFYSVPQVSAEERRSMLLRARGVITSAYGSCQRRATWQPS